LLINNKKRIFLEFSFILAIIFSLAVVVVISAKSYKITSYPSTAPTIDGIIEVGEWQGGKESKIPLIDIWVQGPGQIIEISVISMYCNNSFLYLGITAPIGTLASYITIMIYFHTNAEDEFIVDSKVSPGNDLKIFSVNENYSYDAVTIHTYNIVEYANDTEVGGTNDLEVKYKATSFESTFEFKMPLNSGDINGGDINLDISGSIKTYIILNSHENDNCELFININSVFPISPISILLGLVFVGSMSLLIKRKSTKNH